MPVLALIVLAAGTLVSPAPKDSDLPPIPPIFDDSPPPTPTPVIEAAPPPRIPSPPAAPVAKPPATLLEVPWIEGGSASAALEMTSLVGAFAARTGVDFDVKHGPFTMGLGFRTGASSVLSLTTFDAHGSWRFWGEDAYDVSAGVHLLAGSATPPTGETPKTGVVGLSPDVAIDARLFPWLHARAELAYRFVNAGAWAGPPGDRMGGLALTAGLVFGAF